MAVKFEALEKLRERLRESNHDFRGGTEIFSSLNIDKVARDLDLVAAGKRRGESNQPAKASRNPDDLEHTVIELVEEEKRKSHQTIEDQLQSFSGRLGSLEFEEQFSAIRQANASGLADFKGEIAVGLDTLHGLRRALNTAETEHTWFKEKHGLVRAARLHEGPWHIFRFMLLIVMFGLETIGNASLLATGNEQGFFGGIMLAWMFSFLNIVVAVLAAVFCARLVTHRSWLRRAVGGTAILLYLAFAFGLNLLLAHYREVSTRMSEDWTGNAGTLVLTSMRENLFGLTDVNSILLFLIGFVFSLIAFTDGCFIVDPYWGYSSVEKRLRSAREEYVNAKADLIETLKDTRDDHNEKVEDVVKQLGSRKREFNAIVDHRARLVSLFEQHQVQLERACNQLLAKYREANIEARTEPPPKRFSNAYKLERVKVKVSSDGSWNDADLSADIRTAQDELSAQVKLIGLECEKGIEQYKALDNLFPDSMNVQTTA